MGQANPTIRQLAPGAKRSLRAIRTLSSTPAASPIQHTGDPRPLMVGLTGWYSAYLKKIGLQEEVWHSLPVPLNRLRYAECPFRVPG